MDDGLVEELSSLRAEVARLRAEMDRPDSGLSRRRLLRAAPVVALGGALAAVAGASPAAAADGDPVLQGQSNTFTGTTSLQGGGGDDAPALDISGGERVDQLSVGPFPPGGDTLLSVTPHPGPQADTLPAGPTASISGFEVSGPSRHWGSTALQAQSVGPAAAVSVSANDGFDQPDGPDGDTVPYPATGVAVVAGAGTGIAVQMGDGTGLDVRVSGETTGKDAVTIEYAGTSRAFYAVSSSHTNINGTVTGVNEGHGIGVWGEQRNDTVSGYGVIGVAGALGRGAQFQGGAAAVRLVPTTASTHPSTGKVGDVYVDRSARIWFCTHTSAGTTAATWRQLAFV